MRLRLISVAINSIIVDESHFQVPFLDGLRSVGGDDLADLYSTFPPECERVALEELLALAESRRSIATQLLTMVKDRRRDLVKAKISS